MSSSRFNRVLLYTTGGFSLTAIAATAGWWSTEKEIVRGPNSTYVVRSVTGLPNKGRVLHVSSYPPQEDARYISTNIGLWEVDANVSGKFTWSYWKSIFNNKKDYNILLHQKDPTTKKTNTFVLYETDKVDESDQAFKRLCHTVEPLVDDCTLMLTKGLLEAIVVPEPRNPEDLGAVITDLMQTTPDAHPDWVKVLRALALQAISNNSSEGMEKLISNGLKLDVKDSEDNTLVHSAVMAGSTNAIQRITSTLSEEERNDIFNATNKEGKTAIDCAFEQNNPDIVSCLIQSGVNIAKPEQEGNNIIHLAAENDNALCIQAAHHGKKDFIQNQKSNGREKQQLYDALNSPNSQGLTPLMVSVQKGYINSSVSILQAEANPDVQNPQTGDTALHYAVQKGSVALVKAIIAFGGNINIKNKDGLTPLQMAQKGTDADQKVCSQVLKETSDAIDQANTVYAATPLIPNIPRDSVFVLCLDGGGVRGLLTLQILIAIYNRMKHLQPDCAPIEEYFDYVAGTSVGGLIALSCTALKASLEASRAAVFKVADDVFCTCPTFTSEISDGIAKDTFGLESKISDFKQPRIIIHTVDATKNPPNLRKICNFGSYSSDWKVWEAARATTAAPIYFPPHQDQYIDGGVMANNPTLSAMTEIFQQAQAEGKSVKLGLVLSLGTGSTSPAHVSSVEVYVPTLSNIFTTIARIPKTLSGLGSVLNLFISQSTQSDGDVVEIAEAWCRSTGAQYFRLSPLLASPIDLAESKKDVIAAMMYEGTLYTLRNAKEIDTVARILLSRKRRAK